MLGIKGISNLKFYVIGGDHVKNNLRLKKTMGIVLAFVMTFSSVICSSSVFADEAESNINLYSTNAVVITESKGWHESAYVKWTEYSGAESYNVYIKKSGGQYTKIDDELVRAYPGYYRADALGLGAGNYIMKVVPVVKGHEIAADESETAELVVDNYVREGFAFSDKSPYGYTTGAYNKDGTLKANADVIYISNENKDSITVNGNSEYGIGLYNIMAYRQSKKIETPMAIRFIGKVEMPAGVQNYMLAVTNTKNVTIEGVGEDATVHGWGITMKRSCNVEVRNIGIMWYGGVGGDGDSLSLDTENKNIFMHNIDFFYGAPGKDSDQAKGDGSIDLKARTDYVTASYNHFWDSGKSCVAGGVWESKNPDDPEAKIFITYHHNWFDHSDSRHPRCVAGNVHVYNNYYDGNAVYGIGAAVQSSVYVEGNYFRNVPRPMIIATQGSDVYDSSTGTYASKGTLSGQTGGMIKAYGNVYVTPKRFVDQNTTPDPGQIDAYTVESRDEKVPDTVKAMSGGSTYNNFDTDSNVMYSYNLETAENAKNTVAAQAGRMSGGDFKWEFTAEDDSQKAVDEKLQSAIINYQDKIEKLYGTASAGAQVETTETTTASTEVTTELGTEATTEGFTEITTEKTTVDFVWNRPEDSHSNMWYASENCNSFVGQGTMASSTRKKTNGVSLTNPDGSTTNIEALTESRKMSSNTNFTVTVPKAGTISVYIISNSTNPTGELTVAPKENTNVIMGGATPPNGKTGNPFVFSVNQGGTYTVTNGTNKEADLIMVYFDEASSVTKYNLPVVVTNNTNKATVLKIDDQEIPVDANVKAEANIQLAKGVYSISSSDIKLKAVPKTITVNGDIKEPIAISIENITDKVIVTDSKDGYVSSYNTITDALNSDETSAGCKLYIMPGYYNECFEINKGVTLARIPDETGEVVIYGAKSGYGGNMNGTVRVAAGNVTLKDITVVNNINANYGDIKALQTGGTPGAALISDGDNSVYENCRFVGVQDTVNTYHYSSGKSSLKHTFNNCQIYGVTDVICGSGIAEFNNCEFRFFTGVLSEKSDGIMFAPSNMAKWTVNGGKLINDEASVATNFYYARAWEDNSSVSQTLDIYGMENKLKMGTGGLMGFKGVTGGGAEHSTNDYKFNVYAGADNKSELIATSNVTGVDIFEMSKTPVIDFESKDDMKLIAGIFGENVSAEFIENILPDITELGFVSENNANAAAINAGNTLSTTIVYKKIESESGFEYSLKDIPRAENGGYFAIGVLSEINTVGTFNVVPYVKFDASYNSSKGLDEEPIYKFGAPISVTISNN